MRFDEVELQAVPVALEIDEPPAPVQTSERASFGRRFLALLVDLSLFAALTLTLSPLLPEPRTWIHVTALAGFVVVLSYYYFVGSWLLWGKTIGGNIFDVRVTAEAGTMSLRAATVRWVALYLSLLTAGLGLLFALPDRLSGTRSV